MTPVSPVIPMKIDDELRLEPLEPLHAGSLFELVDQDRDRLGRWLPWVAKTLTAEDSLAFIEDSKRRRDLDSGGDGSGDWAIVVDAAGSARTVGVIGLHDSSPTNRRIAIGYWVSGDHTGHGHITRAARAVTTRCIAAGFHRVEIRARTDNARSRAVAERLEFQLEGVMRAAEWIGETSFDHAVFARIATP
jgi:ribosomal-protein-serine acetyltransferase